MLLLCAAFLASRASKTVAGPRIMSVNGPLIDADIVFDILSRIGRLGDGNDGNECQDGAGDGEAHF